MKLTGHGHHQNPLELVNQNEALEVSVKPPQEVDEHIDEEKSSRSLNGSPDLTLAVERSLGHQCSQQLPHETQHSSRHSIDLSENQRNVREKHHARTREFTTQNREYCRQRRSTSEISTMPEAQMRADMEVLMARLMQTELCRKRDSKSRLRRGRQARGHSNDWQSSYTHW